MAKRYEVAKAFKHRSDGPIHEVGAEIEEGPDLTPDEARALVKQGNLVDPGRRKPAKAEPDDTGEGGGGDAPAA